MTKKVALVTGVGPGTGAAIVQRCSVDGGDLFQGVKWARRGCGLGAI
jgi:NAD(P)-dependent dehydrogenase (short-subunit alcohol dehydrogenase family)